MSKLPSISMEIDQTIGLAETEYLKKPELPSSIPPVKEKKKRVVSQKQLDSLKRAREASVLKRKKIKEQKLKDKEEAKALKALKKEPIDSKATQRKEPEIMETIEEERADTPEALIDMNSFNYEKVIGGVFDMIQADKERRKPEKEEKWKKRFKDAEDIRIDERNKLLDLVKQMEKADGMKSTTQKAKPKPKPKVNPAKLLRGEPDWDSCFAPRRGGNNFF